MTPRSLQTLIALIVMISTTPSHAADVRASGSRLCAFNLDGPIVAGDRDRLDSLVSASRLDEFDERTMTLCLNSPGGSFDEGIKISELIYGRGLSTLVADRNECYSACAFVFMSGVISDQIAPYRKLSSGAVLGFHAPYLSLSGAKFSKEEVDEISQEMRKAILALLKISSRKTQLAGSDFLKKSLISRILENGPTDIFVVKTIAEAARWDIEIYDAIDKDALTGNVDEMKNLCTNFHHANMDEQEPSPDLSVKLESYASKFQPDDFRVMVIDSRTKDTVCEIYPRTMKGSQRVHFYACSYDLWSSKSFGDCRAYKTSPIFGKSVPSFFVLDPNTKLRRFN
jgi:hypothetical protein